jgi:hypothetical protein
LSEESHLIALVLLAMYSEDISHLGDIFFERFATLGSDTGPEWRQIMRAFHPSGAGERLTSFDGAADVQPGSQRLEILDWIK